jgi:hypothetical protein
MARTRSDRGKSKAASGKPAARLRRRYFCSLSATPTRVFGPGIMGARLRALNTLADKWVNGTVLHFYFFDRETDRSSPEGVGTEVTWVGDEAQKRVVREAFRTWQDVGIGVRFAEVTSREDAEVRIGFMQGDGSWSYLGRQILYYGPNERTMNFGWPLEDDLDTALHEIGHTLGFPHEHQNPYSGIEWNAEAVYASLAAPPNEWPRETTHWNIIRKLSPMDVQGTVWDPDSIMHYPFEKGLIRRPVKYRRRDLVPAGGLSVRDREWVKRLYPPLRREPYEELRPGVSVLLHVSAGAQRDFSVSPAETRFYEFRTFGAVDSVMVLFEDEDGEPRYRAGDDDGGEDKNAYLRVRLQKGRRYVLRVRLYFSARPAEAAVMMW